MERLFKFIAGILDPEQKGQDLDRSARGKVAPPPGLEEAGAAIANRHLKPGAPLEGFGD